jgi:2-oxoglutarate ferredoxin oxidoreductase subunit delta
MCSKKEQPKKSTVKMTPVNECSKESKMGDTDSSPKGTVYLTEERCKGCSFCVVFCPTKALVMGGRMNSKGYRLPELAYPEKCNGCDMCGLFCPDFAIFGVSFKKQKKRESGETP